MENSSLIPSLSRKDRVEQDHEPDRRDAAHDAQQCLAFLGFFHVLRDILHWILLIVRHGLELVQWHLYCISGWPQVFLENLILTT